MRKMIMSLILVAAATAEAGDALDRAAISTGIAQAKPKVMACGNTAKIGGKVTVKVAVGPDGRVTSAVSTGSDADLGACVAAAVKTVTFAKTTNGGTFSYPFIFDAKQPDAIPPTAGMPAEPAPPSGDDSLDRAMITSAIAKVKAKITACDAKLKVGGTVRVKVTVKPDGHVATATHEGADAKLGQCVVNVIKTVVFAKTAAGGSFSYPFVFGAPTTTAPSGELDPAMVTNFIAMVKPRIAACGDRFKAGGTVKVSVTVAADGKITSATQVGGATDLGACVLAAIREVRFGAIASGGSFTYPFVFGAAAATAALDVAIDRAAISDAMAKAKAPVSACGSAKIHGKVKIKATVAPDGHVSAVSVDETPDAALGACVAAAIKGVTFKATQQGGSFGYPFVF